MDKLLVEGGADVIDHRRPGGWAGRGGGVGGREGGRRRSASCRRLVRDGGAAFHAGSKLSNAALRSTLEVNWK